MSAPELQMPKMISVKTVKWTIGWKIHFADLVKDDKSVACFPLLAQIQVGRNDAWLLSAVSKWQPLKLNFRLLLTLIFTG